VKKPAVLTGFRQQNRLLVKAKHRKLLQSKDYKIPEDAKSPENPDGTQH
jgi:hypothetical protein